MNDPFGSPKRRLARANEHISALRAGWRAFAETKPYVRVVEPDLDSGDQIHKVKLARQMPDVLTDIAVESVEALRSALDLVGYAAAVAGGVARPKKSYFPIADDATSLDNDIIRRGRCKDLPADILTHFRSFKPYKGGNDFIWALNKACNTSKHCLISAAGITVGKMEWNAYIEGSGHALYGPNWDWQKNENDSRQTAPWATVRLQRQAQLFLAFGKIEGLQGEPALPVLRKIASEVERIVSSTESECRQLGLIA